MVTFAALWRSIFERRRVEQSLSEELAAYADLLADEKARQGMSRQDARRQALIEIGGVEQVKEQVRDIRIGNTWDSLYKDLRQASRSLLASKGTALLAMVTLALGLGATTLIFSVVYSALLQPSPFSDPQRLVQLWETRKDQGWQQASFSMANFWDVRSQNTTFESMAALLFTDMNLTGEGNPKHLSVAQVTAQFLHVLGVTPVFGRDFDAMQDQPQDDNAVVLLSSKFWHKAFGASRTILGKSLQLNGHAYTVIGVLPAAEPWLNGADAFVPLVYSPQAYRGNFEASVVGRLKANTSLAVVNADLKRVADHLGGIYREDRTMGVRMAPSADWGAKPVVRRALWVLLCAVGLLLLIACVNIANLLLARASARNRELRLREALGASRFRIVRLMFSESLLLAVAGTGFGLLLAYWGLYFVRASGLDGIPNIASVRINGWILGFSGLTMLAATLVSGLAPAVRSSGGNIVTVLREGDRAQTSGRAETRLRTLLVAAEVSLSLMLVLGAGLFVRSFSRILSVNRGFQTAGRIVATINIPFNYDEARAQSLTSALLERSQHMPGIKNAGTVNSKPIVGWDPGMGIGAPDAASAVSHNVPWASWRFVSSRYLNAVGVPLLRGRNLNEGDFRSKERRVVVSESIANLLWPQRNPVGRRIALWKGQGNDTAEVVGVVANTRDHGLDVEPTRVVYLPYIGQTNSPVQLVLETALPPAQTAASLRAVMATIDANVPVSDVETFDALVARSLGSRRFNTILLTIFAMISLMLAISGIYGVQAYTIARRTSEIGIRMALGAGRTQILSLVIMQGMRPILLGIAVGVAASLALSRLLASLLFDVKPADPESYLIAVLLILLTGSVACFVPARRAMKVDPVAAMREG